MTAQPASNSPRQFEGVERGVSFAGGLRMPRSTPLSRKVAGLSTAPVDRAVPERLGRQTYFAAPGETKQGRTAPTIGVME